MNCLSAVLKTDQQSLFSISCHFLLWGTLGMSVRVHFSFGGVTFQECEHVSRARTETFQNKEVLFQEHADKDFTHARTLT